MKHNIHVITNNNGINEFLMCDPIISEEVTFYYSSATLHSSSKSMAPMKV